MEQDENVSVDDQEEVYESDNEQNDDYDPFLAEEQEESFYTQTDYRRDETLSPSEKEAIFNDIAKMREINTDLREHGNYMDKDLNLYSRREAEDEIRRLENDILKKRGIPWWQRPASNPLSAFIKGFIKALVMAVNKSYWQKLDQIDRMVRDTRASARPVLELNRFDMERTKPEKEPEKGAKSKDEPVVTTPDDPGKDSNRKGPVLTLKEYGNDDHSDRGKNDIGTETEEKDNSKEDTQREHEKTPEELAEEERLKKLEIQQRFRAELETERDKKADEKFKSSYNDLQKEQKQEIDREILTENINRLGSFTPDEITKNLAKDVIKSRFDKASAEKKPDENNVTKVHIVQDLARKNPAIAKGFASESKNASARQHDYLNIIKKVPETLEYFKNKGDVFKDGKVTDTFLDALMRDMNKTDQYAMSQEQLSKLTKVFRNMADKETAEDIMKRLSDLLVKEISGEDPKHPVETVKPELMYAMKKEIMECDFEALYGKYQEAAGENNNLDKVFADIMEEIKVNAEQEKVKTAEAAEKTGPAQTEENKEETETPQADSLDDAIPSDDASVEKEDTDRSKDNAKDEEKTDEEEPKQYGDGTLTTTEDGKVPEEDVVHTYSSSAQETEENRLKDNPFFQFNLNHWLDPSKSEVDQEMSTDLNKSESKENPDKGYEDDERGD